MGLPSLSEVMRVGVMAFIGTPPSTRGWTARSMPRRTRLRTPGLKKMEK